MESEQNNKNNTLMQQLAETLPKVNFYRFCQLLEQINGDEPSIGRHESPTSDPIRFAPSVEMSFPAGELKNIEHSPYSNRPATVRTRFLGLYGVDSALPLSLINNIICREENYQAMTDFLDIFNHRIITQFYRIWLKYHYPASFLSGGRDSISKCLLGLTGLGIKGASEQIGTPSSRFLALLGLITQKTRPAGGIVGLIRLLVDDADVSVSEFYPIWQTVDTPSKLGRGEQNRIDGSAVLGSRFRESSQTIHIKITPKYREQVADLLPDGQLHRDIFSLLRAYLGYRVDAKLTLYIARQFLPRTALTHHNSRLGQTASFTVQNNSSSQFPVAVNLGRYSGIDYVA
ncbi:type VI secretion system baseplate subunit TssG [Orbaceae bacterium ESL0721]|nr:type VI secretion system baseplate subunit TssG [Orbaceae bacterium ESL0721]